LSFLAEKERKGSTIITFPLDVVKTNPP